MNKRLILIFVMILCIQITGCSQGEREKDMSLAISYIDEEQYEKALIELDKINTGKSKESNDEDFYYGVCYNRLGLYKLAEEHINYYQIDHNDTKGIYEKAISLYGAEDYITAIEKFKSIEEAYLEIPEYYYYYGNCYYYEKEYQEAVKLLEKAVALEPERYRYNKDLLYAYNSSEEYEKGIEACNNYLKILDEQKETDPDERYDVEYQRGDFYYYDGQYEEALGIYSGLAEEYEESEPAYIYYDMAKCYVKMEDFQNTYEYLQKCFENDIYYYDDYQEDDVFKEFSADEKYGKMIEEMGAE